jgi:hypothetical protein
MQILRAPNMEQKRKLLLIFGLMLGSAVVGALASAFVIDRKVNDANLVGLLGDIRFLTDQEQKLSLVSKCDPSAEKLLASNRGLLAGRMAAFEALNGSRLVDAQSQKLLDAAAAVVRADAR